MSANDFVVFALQIAVMLGCAQFFGHVMRRLGQPAVLGEMIGGIVLGPTLFGMLAPASYAWLFPSSGPVAMVRGGVIKLGMLFFLFIVGLEIDLSQLRKHGISALLVGVIGTLIPLAAGVALVYALPDIWGLHAQEHRKAVALFIGASMANSANPVLARILMDLGLLKQEIGAIIMTATIVDDLVGWSLLAYVMSDSSPTAGGAATGGIETFLFVIAFFAAMLIVGRWLCSPALNWTRTSLAWPSGYIGTISVIVFISAALAEKVGIHAFLGPFLIGVALADDSPKGREAHDVIQHFVLSFFVPIYFVSMGLSANFIANFDLVLVLAILATACISKIGSVYLAGRISGLSSPMSLAVGYGMNARGATGIILAAVAFEGKVIDARAYVALVIMCIVTSLLAGPTMTYALNAHRRTNPNIVPNSTAPT